MRTYQVSKASKGNWQIHCRVDDETPYAVTSARVTLSRKEAIAMARMLAGWRDKIEIRTLRSNYA